MGKENEELLAKALKAIRDASEQDAKMEDTASTIVPSVPAAAAAAAAVAGGSSLENMEDAPRANSLKNKNVVATQASLTAVPSAVNFSNNRQETAATASLRAAAAASSGNSVADEMTDASATNFPNRPKTAATASLRAAAAASSGNSVADEKMTDASTANFSQDIPVSGSGSSSGIVGSSAASSLSSVEDIHETFYEDIVAKLVPIIKDEKATRCLVSVVFNMIIKLANPLTQKDAHSYQVYINDAPPSEHTFNHGFRSEYFKNTAAKLTVQGRELQYKYVKSSSEYTLPSALTLALQFSNLILVPKNIYCQQETINLLSIYHVDRDLKISEATPKLIKQVEDSFELYKKSGVDKKNAVIQKITSLNILQFENFEEYLAAIIDAVIANKFAAAVFSNKVSIATMRTRRWIDEKMGGRITNVAPFDRNSFDAFILFLQKAIISFKQQEPFEGSRNDIEYFVRLEVWRQKISAKQHAVAHPKEQAPVLKQTAVNGLILIGSPSSSKEEKAGASPSQIEINENLKAAKEYFAKRCVSSKNFTAGSLVTKNSVITNLQAFFQQTCSVYVLYISGQIDKNNNWILSNGEVLTLAQVFSYANERSQNDTKVVIVRDHLQKMELREGNDRVLENIFVINLAAVSNSKGLEENSNFPAKQLFNYLCGEEETLNLAGVIFPGKVRENIQPDFFPPELLFNLRVDVKHVGRALKKAAIDAPLFSENELSYFLRTQAQEADLLEIKRHAMTEVGIKYLAEYLPTSSLGKTLAELLICGHLTLDEQGRNIRTIGQQGLQAIAMMLKTKSVLRRLDLFGFGKTGENGDESARVLAEALSNNVNLVHLGLRNCQISPQGISALVRVLANHRSLRSIDFSFNSLGSEGCKALETLLAQDTLLTRVNLANIGIDNASCTMLCKALLENSNSAVTHLNLSYNPIFERSATTDSAFHAIANLLSPAFNARFSKQPQLEILELHGRPLFRFQMLRLIAGLQGNRSLHSLKLGIPESKEVVELLVKALEEGCGAYLTLVTFDHPPHIAQAVWNSRELSPHKDLLVRMDVVLERNRKKIKPVISRAVMMKNYQANGKNPLKHFIKPLLSTIEGFVRGNGDNKQFPISNYSDAWLDSKYCLAETQPIKRLEQCLAQLEQINKKIAAYKSEINAQKGNRHQIPEILTKCKQYKLQILNFYYDFYNLINALASIKAYMEAVNAGYNALGLLKEIEFFEDTELQFIQSLKEEKAEQDQDKNSLILASRVLCQMAYAYRNQSQDLSKENAAIEKIVKCNLAALQYYKAAINTAEKFNVKYSATSVIPPEFFYFAGLSALEVAESGSSATIEECQNIVSYIEMSIAYFQKFNSINAYYKKRAGEFLVELNQKREFFIEKIKSLSNSNNQQQAMQISDQKSAQALMQQGGIMAPLPASSAVANGGAAAAAAAAMPADVQPMEIRDSHLGKRKRPD